VSESRFTAVWLESEAGQTKASLREIDDTFLPEGDVTLTIEYSSINFKDALAITGRAPVVRQFPMIPGIDMAGIVSESSDPNWKVGDRVLQVGWGHGELVFGGLAGRARVWGKHLVPIPGGLDAQSSMSLGTAGFTAALAVLALIKHGIQPGDGKILVTGAGGGVGGVAIALLKRRGYTAIASTGRPGESERLRSLGASEILDRSTLSKPGKALSKELWIGAIDSVGSHTLANVCAATCAGGMVVACGNVQGLDFPGTVAPFILRGVRLVGIRSPYVQVDDSRAAWAELAELPRDVIDSMVSEISLEEVIPSAERVIGGQVPGRLTVRVRPS